MRMPLPHPTAIAAIAAILCALSPNALSQAGGKHSSLDEAAMLRSLANLGEQIASYRGALQRMAREEGSLPARELLTSVDGLTVEAARLVASGRHADANDKMREAYRRIVEGLSRLQAGQTVTHSLKFASPAEEYAYEEKRYQSNQMMVAMMLNEGRAGPERRRTVDDFISEAERLRTEAAALARGGSHTSAIATMEKANAQLNRALQAMGVPVF